MKKIAFLPLIVACGTATVVSHESSSPDSKHSPIFIPASPQRSGDSAAGYQYLITGNYIRSGVPLALYKTLMGSAPENLLHRTGENADIAYGLTAVKAANGEIVVAPNCLQCHAQLVDNKLIVGLGNTTTDYSQPAPITPEMLEMGARMLQLRSPTQYEAAAPFLKTMITIGNQLQTKARGVNPAVHLTAILSAHRDPETLRWHDSASSTVPDTVVPSDVPAWWLLKKKHAMFHTGIGRGDFGRFLMASNLLTVNDSTEANDVDHRISDVLAYIDHLQAPKYPYSIDQALASRGRSIYVQTCAECHGNREADGDYPNLLIPAEIIKTDSLAYASYYGQNAPYIAWGAKSWFAQGDHPARLVLSRGYVAPPLDGVWITAPYFHNGSVPTLEDVLNSKARPTYWSRDFDHQVYDSVKGGWQYTSYETSESVPVYNTTIPGYGNQGHTFGDALRPDERRAVIEYLKTL